ncbi:hypothetical protein [Shewanella sp. OMA3-2]|uniref:hypothetical protein n=1 Tax=Shewanella sp. OMA3-2 TaxID=2908650 RepID=UPI001F40BC97|nr:hypothetical protein [Shewanella sp. OMA3-2]UJF22360.1 hypothetical protein L0B17_02730 [Shewanella sp. OMA3-2]
MKTLTLFRFVLFSVIFQLSLNQSVAGDDWAQLTDKAKSKQTELNNQSAVELGKDGVYDSEGRPIKISQPAFALEYNADEASIAPYQQSAKKSTKGAIKTSAKTKPSATANMADDPSCRWLNNRISYLQGKVRSENRHQQHFDKELSARLSEWKCLQCAEKGPSQGDHDRCQYKR